MAHQNQTRSGSSARSQQHQQSGQGQHAPRGSDDEVAPPRIERPEDTPAGRPITDWASI